MAFLFEFGLIFCEKNKKCSNRSKVGEQAPPRITLDAEEDFLQAEPLEAKEQDLPSGTNVNYNNLI